MGERIIQPVQNNSDKQQTYGKLMSRYNQAMRGGFYFEAIMISYAMIEDRLRSTLYHMGFLSNREAHTIWKKSKSLLLEIIETYKNDCENNALGINTLEGKLKVIRCVLKWAINTEDDYHYNKHLRTLKSQLEGTDLEQFLSAMDQIQKWKEPRNEMVHAMLNKRIGALEDACKTVAEEGMRLARIIDNQERILKKGNKIRRSANLPMN